MHPGEPPPVPPGPGAPRRARVLVVEDEALVALELAAGLALAGYEVVGPFGRVAPALDRLADGLPDAALLDVNIAGEPVEPVADLLADRGVPFAFVTAYGEPPWPRHAGRPRLPKPAAGRQVLALLEGLLGG
jgi:DNA-binding NarL/FixJ family response regulator